MSDEQLQGRPHVAIIGTRGYPSYYGGFETAVRRIAPYLAGRGWTVTVFGRPGQVRDDDPQRDERVRSVITRGRESRSLSTLTHGLSATRGAASLRPDVALVMNVANGFWLPLLRRAGIPTVVNVDGIEWERDKWSRLGKLVFKRGAHATARNASQIVVDSLEMGRRWQEEFRRSGVFIPYGGDVWPVQPVEPGLTPGRYALLVSRFVPENSVPEFLTAAEKISERFDVVIVGSEGFGGELDQRVQKLSEANPRVHWLGHIDDDRRLHALWQHAGAYFHGHSVGGTNPALVQAMACGAPVVARDTPYNREVLSNAGRFVAPEAASIAEGVIQLLDNAAMRADMSARARQRAASDYDWRDVCERYESALLQTMRGGAMPR